MPENIAGYMDLTNVKGQYYRFAASPKPVVFTGNFDNISDEDSLLVKAMHVTRSQAEGTFPNDTANDFLITTVKYGDSLYLQTAYTYNDGNECYEYRRIYNGEWSQWICTDSNLESMATDVKNAYDLANSCNTAITGNGGVNEQLRTLNSSIKDLKTKDTNLDGSITNINNNIKTINSKITLEDVSSKYSVSKTGGAWNCSAILVRKFGNVVTMRVEFSVKKNVNVNAGSNAFVGTINAPNGYLPFFTSFLISCFVSSNIVAWVNEDGSFTVRVLNSAIKPGSDTIIGIGGTFIVGG